MYVDTCMEGYRNFGFDETYLLEAHKRAEEAVKDEG